MKTVILTVQQLTCNDKDLFIIIKGETLLRTTIGIGRVVNIGNYTETKRRIMEETIKSNQITFSLEIPQIEITEDQYNGLIEANKFKALNTFIE